MPRRKARNPYREPERCIRWKRVRVYKTVYDNGAGDTITVTSLFPPDKNRTFRSPTGKRKFTATSTKRFTKEVIIVARKKKDAEVEEIITDEELEELEGLDELDEELEDDELEEDEEFEDEEEDEEEDEDEDDEDEEEEPAPKKRRKGAPAKSKKSASKKSPPKRKSAAERGVVGTVEVAEAAGTTPRQLRIVLRRFQGNPFTQDEDSGRWEWSSLNHPHVKKLIKMFADGDTGGRAKDDEAKTKSTARKTRAAKAKAATKTKSGTKKRRRAA